MSQPIPKVRNPCTEPGCGCDTPAFTEPMEALKFLSGRFKHAGVSDGVALLYAEDIDAILAKSAQTGPTVANAHPIPEKLMERLRSLDEDCFNLRYDRQVSLRLELLDDLQQALLTQS